MIAGGFMLQASAAASCHERAWCALAVLCTAANHSSQQCLVVNSKNPLLCYGWSPVQHGPIYHDITYSIAMTATRPKSDFDFAIGIPYVALKGELWVFVVRIWEKIDHLYTVFIRAWPTSCCTSSATWLNGSGRRCTIWPRCSSTVSTTGSWRHRRPANNTHRQMMSPSTKWTTPGGSTAWISSRWIWQCTCPISHNTPLWNRKLCSKVVYCGIWDRCIVGFVQFVFFIYLITR